MYIALTGKHASYIVLPNLSCIISFCSCHLLLREFQFFHWFWAWKKIKIMFWQRTPIAYFGFFLFYFPISFLPPSHPPTLPSFLLSKNILTVLHGFGNLASLNRESSLIQTPPFYLFLGLVCPFVIALAIRRREEARLLQWCLLRSWDGVVWNQKVKHGQHRPPRGRTLAVSQRNSLLRGRPPFTHTVSFSSFRGNPQKHLFFLYLTSSFILYHGRLEARALKQKYILNVFPLTACILFYSPIFSFLW